MLTEGTDVPNAQTVFLTRQTTSSILLTQMIGRALRGSQFGGTDEAYIVSFIDNWKQVINWGKADFSGGKDDDIPEYGEQVPLDLISIELVRRWAEQVKRRKDSSLPPFLTLLPLGWYLLEFQTLVSESEDNEVRQLLLVFDNEKESYEGFIQNLTKQNIKDFAEIDVSFDNKLNQIEEWKQEYFKNSEEYIGANLIRNIFHIARHVAQNNGKPPKWFDFDERKNHDLDEIARKFIKDDIGSKTKNDQLKAEYEKTARYWNVIYSNYNRFKEQYDACENRILNPPEPPPDGDDCGDKGEVELTKEIRRLVKERDGKRCLCCGEENSRLLQVDHIKPRYYGGDHSLDNLQTLCVTCNRTKNTQEIDFRKHETILETPPSEFLKLDLQKIEPAAEAQQWKKFLSRSVNFFYRCAAVDFTNIKGFGTSEYPWEIYLHAGNNPDWFEPHRGALTTHIRELRSRFGFTGPYVIMLKSTRESKH